MGVGVEIDMEHSSVGPAELEVFRPLCGAPGLAGRDAGRDAPHAEDLVSFTDVKPRIRLVKGAFLEPIEKALQEPAGNHRPVPVSRRLGPGEPAGPGVRHARRRVHRPRQARPPGSASAPHFEFQMLHGVRRDVQRRLADEGYRIRIYLPYGTQWYPYLMRRMAERPANLLLFLRSLIAAERPHSPKDVHRFQSSASVAGNLRTSTPFNEPVRDYRPGSPEATALLAEIDRVREGPRHPQRDRRRGPADAGHRRRGGPARPQRVLGRYSPATSGQVDAAIAAALERGPAGRAPPGGTARPSCCAPPSWSAASTATSCSPPPCSASRRPSTRPRSTPPASSPTSSATTPTSPSRSSDPAGSPPGEFNFLDHRGLEGFVLAITPFNFTAIGGNLPTIPALMGNTVAVEAVGEVRAGHRGGHAGADEAGMPPA